MTAIAYAPASAGISVRHTISGGYDVGLLLENDGILWVRVSSNDRNPSTTGLLLQGTSRVTVDHNRLYDNTTSGIQIDAGSSGDTLRPQRRRRERDDVIDDGEANCWRNNEYTTGSVPACP